MEFFLSDTKLVYVFPIFVSVVMNYDEAIRLRYYLLPSV